MESMDLNIKQAWTSQCSSHEDTDTRYFASAVRRPSAEVQKGMPKSHLSWIKQTFFVRTK